MIAFACLGETGFASLDAAQVRLSNAQGGWCRLHAACVLQHTNLLVFAPGGLYALAVVESLLAGAMYLAAICHDYDHPGTQQHCCQGAVARTSAVSILPINHGAIIASTQGDDQPHMTLPIMAQMVPLLTCAPWPRTAQRASSA